MACFHPRKAWFSADGGRPSFDEKRGFDIPKLLSCGQCIGCRVRIRAGWALRLFHESRMHEHSSFVTLTYDDEHVPQDGSLSKRDFPLFMKRLRKSVAPLKVRFYQCAEYGSLTKRPHHHALLYGYWPSDAKPVNSRGFKSWFSSRTLEALWGLGSVSVGYVTPASAAYCAKHNIDKLTGKAARKRYSRVCFETGEVYEVVPEFATMSRNPGIAGDWILENMGDVSRFGVDGIYVDNRLCSLPRYYDELIAKHRPKVAMHRETERQLASLEPEREADETPERLHVREVVAKARVAFAKSKSEGL